MTRKDLRAIAAAINGQTIIAAPQTSVNPVEFMRGAVEQRENLTRAIADALAAGNPAFDRVRFLDACGAFAPTPVKGA